MGEKVWISAAEQYGFSRSTLFHWIAHGWIAVYKYPRNCRSYVDLDEVRREAARATHAHRPKLPGSRWANRPGLRLRDPANTESGRLS